MRITKILLVLSVAAWGLLGAVGNLAAWKGTTGAVGAVTSMATFAGGATQWQATTNPAVILAGAVFIVLFKLSSAGLCFAGTWRMWVERRAAPPAFNQAKQLALAGCAVAVFGLFAGWTVIGETWFEMWRAAALLPAADGAFRYGGFIALIALLVGSRED